MAVIQCADGLQTVRRGRTPGHLLLPFGQFTLCPCRVGKILFASQAKISRFKTDLSSLHNLMRSPTLIQLLTNRSKHPLCHIQIPADLQLINLKRQVGWIPRLNI